jgi:hypothetical protein
MLGRNYTRQDITIPVIYCSGSTLGRLLHVTPRCEHTGWYHLRSVQSLKYQMIYTYHLYTDPWGTPIVKSTKLEELEFTVTNCLLSDKYDAIQFKITTLILICSNFCKSIPLSNVGHT